MEKEIRDFGEESILEINISNHDFEEAKGQLKKFSEQDKESLKFDKVKTHEKLLDWEYKEHGVTGNEFNILVEQVQDYISRFYDRQQDLVEEFGQVYKALEALDRDYIQAILSSVAAIEKTNQNILVEQARIDQAIDKQKATLLALKKFKNSVNEKLSQNSEDDFKQFIEGLETRVAALERLSSGYQEVENINRAELDSLKFELDNTKNQLQVTSNRLTTLFVVSGISIGLVIVVLLYTLLR